MEEERLDCLPTHFKLLKMGNDFDLYTERECFSCCYDLHLSAVGCECSPDRYSCLKHASLFCSCEMDRRFVLLRYNIDELNKLLEALEGESLALEFWANKNFGIVSADLSEVCIDKPEVERDNGLKEGESSTGCIGSDNDNINDNKLVIDKDKADRSGSKDLVFVHITNNHDNKGVSVEDKVCCLETKKEQDNMEFVGEVDLSLSFSVVKTKFSSFSRDVHNSCTSHGGKYEVDDVQEAIDTQNTSIPLTHESCLMQMLGTSVMPISLGSVVHGKLWRSKHAIYPKGFKSRVNFLNILNPTRICSYISEVIDAGFLGPIFKVTMEEHPNEAFTDTSADKCWESVLKRLHDEIMRRRNLGELELPSLEPLKSISGLRMFGFLLPSIIQAIEDQDPSHQCVEYWNHKVVPTSSGSDSDNVNSKNFGINLIEQTNDNMGGSCYSLEEMKPILQKASPDELSTMRKLLGSDAECSQWRMALISLMDDIQEACR